MFWDRSRSVCLLCIRRSSAHRPHLEAAAVYDAISYYLDHQADIEQEIAENRFEAVQAQARLDADEKGVVTFPTKLIVLLECIQTV